MKALTGHGQERQFVLEYCLQTSLSQHSLLIDDLGSFVAALKSNGMSAPEILQAQKLLGRGGLVKVYSAISTRLQVFEITSDGLERFFVGEYGLVSYNKKLGNVARLKHERLLRGVRVTSDSIAEELTCHRCLCIMS